MNYGESTPTGVTVLRDGSQIKATGKCGKETPVSSLSPYSSSTSGKETGSIYVLFPKLIVFSMITFFFSGCCYNRANFDKLVADYVQVGSNATASVTELTKAGFKCRKIEGETNSAILTKLVCRRDINCITEKGYEYIDFDYNTDSDKIQKIHHSDPNIRLKLIGL